MRAGSVREGGKNVALTDSEDKEMQKKHAHEVIYKGRSAHRTRALISPAEENAAGSVTRAHGDNEHQVTPAKAALLDSIVQAEGNRAGGGVGVAIDVDKHLGIINAEALLSGANDAQVGLVRDQQSEIILGEGIAF